MTTQTPNRQNGAAYFGQEVRFARLQHQLTQQQLADASGYERPYVTRVEGGTLLGSEHFAEACDRIFTTPGFFARLRERVSERGHPGWFIPYVNLEKEATYIQDFSPLLIMGMLQTREYATAIFRQGHPRETPEALDARVETRLERSLALQRPNPPVLWVVIHEAALRTIIGSREVMAAQFQHLLEVAENPHVTLQVSPYAKGLPAGSSAFVLLTQEEGPAFVYTENLQEGHVEDSGTVVREAQAKYDQLRAAALSPEDSLAFIRDVMEEYAP